MPDPILSSASSHWPALLVLLPLLGSLATAAPFSHLSQRTRGLFFAVLELGLVLYLLTGFEPNQAGLQLSAHYTLRPGFGVELGVDGANILFIVLTALLVFFLTLYELVNDSPSAGRTIPALLVFEALLMGQFATRNILVFGLLGALELIPARRLLQTRGQDSDSRAPHRLYWQFMASGLVLLWLGIVLIGLYHAWIRGFWSFNLDDLMHAPMPLSLQRITFVLLFYSCAIRLAQFPLHAWLPELAKHPREPAFVVLLVGAKVGLYALIRYVLPLLPGAVHDFRLMVAGLGVASIFYGAILALMQIKLHRLLAFALVSQTGMLLVGIFSLNSEGLSGSLLLSFNFSLATAGLFLTADRLLYRAGTVLLPRLGGLFDPLPLLALTFLISALSTMTMPGTPGFDAAHLLLEGAIETHDWEMAIAVAVGNVLTAAFLLYAFQRIFLTRKRETSRRLLHNQPHLAETVLTALICLILLGVGFYVEPWLDLIEATTLQLAEPYRSLKP